MQEGSTSSVANRLRTGLGLRSQAQPLVTTIPPVGAPTATDSDFIKSFIVGNTGSDLVKPENIQNDIFLEEYNKTSEEIKNLLVKNMYITVIMPVKPNGKAEDAANKLFNVIIENNRIPNDGSKGKFPETSEEIEPTNIEIYKKYRTSVMLQNDAIDYKKNVLYKISVLPDSTKPEYNDIATKINNSKIYYPSEDFSKLLNKLETIIYNEDIGPNENLSMLYGSKRSGLQTTLKQNFLGGGGKKKNKVTKRKQKRIRKKNNKTNTSKNTN
jgi:hypothetical protein